MADRIDLILEVDSVLSGSGAYTSQWFDSAGIVEIQVLTSLSGGSTQVVVEESNDQTSTYPVGPFQYPSGGTSRPTARYFRLGISGGTANAAFRAVVRNVTS